MKHVFPSSVFTFRGRRGLSRLNSAADERTLKWSAHTDARELGTIHHDGRRFHLIHAR